ncbi:MAG: hypothetical protein IKP74_05150 [Clostridia bacterium]|nr:hypothetical protein [Clostridia bacterium]
MLKLIGIALVTAAAGLILKGQAGKIAPLVSLSGVLVLLLFFFRRIGGAVAVFCDLAESSALSPYLETLLKVLSCGYLTEIGAGVLRDLGEGSAATALECVGRGEILLLCLPDFLTLTKLALSLAGG